MTQLNSHFLFLEFNAQDSLADNRLSLSERGISLAVFFSSINKTNLSRKTRDFHYGFEQYKRVHVANDALLSCKYYWIKPFGSSYFN